MERISPPDIPVKIADTSATLRSCHVAVQYGRGNVHTDRSSGIWYSLRPSEIRQSSGTPALIVDHLIAIGSVQNNEVADKRGHDTGLNLVARWTVRMTSVTSESVIVGGSKSRQRSGSRKWIGDKVSDEIGCTGNITAEEVIRRAIRQDEVRCEGV